MKAIFYPALILVMPLLLKINQKILRVLIWAMISGNFGMIAAVLLGSFVNHYGDFQQKNVKNVKNGVLV